MKGAVARRVRHDLRPMCYNVRHGAQRCHRADVAVGTNVTSIPRQGFCSCHARVEVAHDVPHQKCQIRWTRSSAGAASRRGRRATSAISRSPSSNGGFTHHDYEISRSQEAITHQASASAASLPEHVVIPAVVTSPELRDAILREGHMWVYDSEIKNIAELHKMKMHAGTLVPIEFVRSASHQVDAGKNFSESTEDISLSRCTNSASGGGPARRGSENFYLGGEYLGTGVWNRSSSITLRLLPESHVEVEETLAGFSSAPNGEQGKSSGNGTAEGADICDTSDREGASNSKVFGVTASASGESTSSIPQSPKTRAILSLESSTNAWQQNAHLISELTERVQTLLASRLHVELFSSNGEPRQHLKDDYYNHGREDATSRKIGDHPEAEVKTDAAPESALYGRILHAESDGVPGVLVDRFGACAAIITYLALGSHAILHETIVEALKLAGVSQIGVRKLVTKKERWCLAGEEFSFSLAAGDDAVFVAKEFMDTTCSTRIEIDSVRLIKNKENSPSSKIAGTSSANEDDFLDMDGMAYEEPGVARPMGNDGASSTKFALLKHAASSSPTKRSLEFAFTLMSSTSKDASTGGINSVSSSSGYETWDFWSSQVRRFLPRLLAQGHGSSPTVLDLWCHLGETGLYCCASNTATESILLEERMHLVSACAANAKRNGLDGRATVLHKNSILAELRNMALAGLKFSLVVINYPLRFGPKSFKQRHGQFGRWCRPDLKGVAPIVKQAASVTASEGYVALKLMLPEQHRSWGYDILRDGVEQADRTASIVREFAPTYDMPRVMTKTLWAPHWFIIRMHD
ncbi:unnamed protein product [Amoebophrya sp. A25]|nr:unnamed protein product [Amoebophrya sp. A25]|eukprot:GSA25T00001121001.1